MLQDFLSTRGDLLIWPLIGLGIFVISFIIVILYVSVGLQDRQKCDRIAALPLADDALSMPVENAKMGDAIR